MPTDLTRQPIRWLGDRVSILDQTRLPAAEVYLETADYREIASAIIELKIRGAPAIGIAGGYAAALGGLYIDSTARDKFLEKLKVVIQAIRQTRPTARNLFGALERMERAAQAPAGVEDIRAALVAEAIKIHEEEAAATGRLSGFGAALIADGFTLLTHCNTGPLAASGYGTALGCILRAKEQGKRVSVFADETRPLLQGARLTAWELQQAGVPVTLITDSAAGYLLRRGGIDAVIVGADRIAANGDTANKIGTYPLAVLAGENKVPFYIAAPTSTIDISLETGAQIPIEERAPEEVTHLQGRRIAPEGVGAFNPAFDVTPHRYISAIITERGIIREPYGEGIRAVME